jgi:hypothetical protein
MYMICYVMLCYSYVIYIYHVYDMLCYVYTLPVGHTTKIIPGLSKPSELRQNCYVEIRKR